VLLLDHFKNDLFGKFDPFSSEHDVNLVLGTSVGSMYKS